MLAPSQNFHSPCWLTFIYKNYVRLIFLQVQVGVGNNLYGSARVRNVICATVGKRVGCSFKYGVYGRVFKIRPVQDSAVWYRRKWSNKLVVLPLVVATDARHC